MSASMRLMPVPEIRNDLQLFRSPTPQQVDELCRLRVEAWRDQADLHPGVTQWRDRWDDIAEHRILLDGQGQILGALRFTLHDDLDDLPDGGVWADAVADLPRPLAYASRMFIVPKWRGKGHSAVLDRAAVEEPRLAGARAVVSMVGSVGRNQDRALRMKDFGWSAVGSPQRNSPDGIHHPTHLPLIFAARFDGAEFA